MGLVIKVEASGGYWKETYFTQCMNKEKAFKKCYEYFKETSSCCLPETLEEALKYDGFSIEVIAEVNTILI